MKRLLLVSLSLLMVMVLGGYCMAEENTYVEGVADDNQNDSVDLPYDEVLSILGELGISQEEFDALTAGHTERLEGYDFSYMFDGESSLQQLHAGNAVKRIAAYTIGEKAEQYILIDLEAGKYYYDRGNVIGYVLNADIQGDLTSEQKDLVEKLFADMEWPLSTASIDNENLSWNLAIETDAGVSRYTNIGLDEQTNEKMMDFLLQLYKIVWNNN